MFRQSEVQTIAPSTNQPVHAVILAAGQARRIGMLSSVGKTHVRYRSAPALANQLATLSQHGIRNATVVCRPENAFRVEMLVAQLADALPIHVDIDTQMETPGPGKAFALALKELPQDYPVLLLLADTIVTSIPDFTKSWVAVAVPSWRRRWCCVSTGEDRLVTEVRDETVGPEDLRPVAVGLYYFHDRASLDVVSLQIATKEVSDAETEISEVLNAYRMLAPLHSQNINEWVDLGDADSIGRATRTHQLVRSSTHVTVDELGVMHKTVQSAVGTAQCRFLSNLSGDTAALFPRILWAAEDHSSYAMEYLNYPTLAELYLYNPGAEELWGNIVESVLRQVRRHLWLLDGEQELSVDTIRARCRVMYLDKLRERFTWWWTTDAACKRDRISVNGHELRAGMDALEFLCDALVSVCVRPVPAVVHGDLNFSNILYCIEPQIIRLLDPRGTFGGDGPVGDARYDVAKLRHSYAGMYDAATHNLYSLNELDSDSFEMTLGPKRCIAERAIDAVLDRAGFCLQEIRTIEVSLFLSMLPLHGDDRRRQWLLYLRGLQLLHALESPGPCCARLEEYPG